MRKEVPVPVFFLIYITKKNGIIVEMILRKGNSGSSEEGVPLPNAATQNGIKSVWGKTKCHIFSFNHFRV